MEIIFSAGQFEEYEYLEQVYYSIAKTAFEHLGIKNNYEIDLSLVGDDEIREINKTYRGINRITDVISFAFNDGVDQDKSIKSENNIPLMLGEIIICIPQALRQAKEIGNTNKRELSFLFVHGLLHLLGYDHIKKEDEEIMFPLQEEILKKAGV